MSWSASIKSIRTLVVQDLRRSGVTIALSVGSLSVTVLVFSIIASMYAANQRYVAGMEVELRVAAVLETPSLDFGAGAAEAVRKLLCANKGQECEWEVHQVPRKSPLMRIQGPGEAWGEECDSCRSVNLTGLPAESPLCKSGHVPCGSFTSSVALEFILSNRVLSQFGIQRRADRNWQIKIGKCVLPVKEVKVEPGVGNDAVFGKLDEARNDEALAPAGTVRILEHLAGLPECEAVMVGSTFAPQVLEFASVDSKLKEGRLEIYTSKTDAAEACELLEEADALYDCFAAGEQRELQLVKDLIGFARRFAILVLVLIGFGGLCSVLLTFYSIQKVREPQLVLMRVIGIRPGLMYRVRVVEAAVIGLVSDAVSLCVFYLLRSVAGHRFAMDFAMPRLNIGIDPLGPTQWLWVAAAAGVLLPIVASLLAGIKLYTVNPIDWLDKVA